VMFKTSRPVLAPEIRNNVAQILPGGEGFLRLLEKSAYEIEIEHEVPRGEPRAIYLSDSWVRAWRRGRPD